MYEKESESTNELPIEFFLVTKIEKYNLNSKLNNSIRTNRKEYHTHRKNINKLSTYNQLMIKNSTILDQIKLSEDLLNDIPLLLRSNSLVYGRNSEGGHIS